MGELVDPQALGACYESSESSSLSIRTKLMRYINESTANY